jgi:starch synthase (maltosyl-transferring)
MPCPSPIIYNLFPPLAGSIKHWENHLPRIAEMGFNWIYLNPFHYPGFSGSLYAVKDYFAFNPRFLEGVEGDPFQALWHFCLLAKEMDMAVMMDLVLNHTSEPFWWLNTRNGMLEIRMAVSSIPRASIRQIPDG